VLIENIIQGTTWKHAIVGIGLNINQTDFPSHLKNATSLKNISGQEHEIPGLLRAICHSIEMRYLELKTENPDDIHKQYLNRMYRLGKEHVFRTDGLERSGKIIGVNEQGLLDVEFAGNRRTFGFKEIEFVI
jgi:BirA family biotin operon repressor/biotin-[acetyl-CoA-carboxylase] ligase